MATVASKAKLRQREARQRRKKGAPVIFRNPHPSRALPPIRVRAVDPEADAGRDSILVEITPGRDAAIKEESAHAAILVLHGLAPKEVRISPGRCDAGIRKAPGSFIREAMMPSTIAGPLVATGATMGGEPWPLPFDALDPRHPTSADVRNLGSFVKQLELTEADYLEACDRARVLIETPAFRSVWEVLCTALDRHEVLSRTDIQGLFGLGDFTWRQWYARQRGQPKPVTKGNRFLPARTAHALEPANEETLRVRIPHALYDRLPVGIRDPDLGEQVTFEIDGADGVITDVLGKSPTIDLSSGFYTTSPDGTGQRVDIDKDGIRLIDAADDVIANLPTDETQTPEFAGHVAADGGIDVVAGTSGAPTDDRKVRWLRASDGAVVATVYGYEEVTGLVGVELRAISQTSTKAGLVNLRAYDSTGSIAELSVQKTDTGGALTNLIEAQVGGAAATFLDGSGASDFEFDISGGWQNWTPTLTGWSANPTGGVYRYKQIGKLVHVAIRQPTDGTSNATTKTISLPVTAATITNMAWDAPCAAVDNGVSLTTNAQATIASAGTTITFVKDYAGGTGGWTASGNHRIRTCNLTYEAA